MTMDCITFNKDINAFINDALTDEELNDFLNHMKTCKNCREELEINYIVHEGMIRLDDKYASLNLAAAYKQNLKNYNSYMRARKRLIIVSNIFRTISFWTLLGTIFVFLRVYFSNWSM